MLIDLSFANIFWLQISGNFKKTTDNKYFLPHIHLFIKESHEEGLDMEIFVHRDEVTPCVSRKIQCKNGFVCINCARFGTGLKIIEATVKRKKLTQMHTLWCHHGSYSAL